MTTILDETGSALLAEDGGLMLAEGEPPPG